MKRVDDESRFEERGWLGPLAECAWNDINRPGCYLETTTGDLYRFPREAIGPAGIPHIMVTTQREGRYVRLSDSHTTPLAILRAIALEHAYFVNF